ncbi:hypothetical protein L1887_04158 [Cichorium endivia]|nr:hypothetical protein L1887_04158 [Cichorium endivia]
MVSVVSDYDAEEDCGDFPSSPPVTDHKAEIDTVYGLCGFRLRRRGYACDALPGLLPRKASLVIWISSKITDL